MAGGVGAASVRCGREGGREYIYKEKDQWSGRKEQRKVKA